MDAVEKELERLYLELSTETDPGIQNDLKREIREIEDGLAEDSQQAEDRWRYGADR